MHPLCEASAWKNRDEEIAQNAELGMRGIWRDRKYGQEIKKHGG